MTNSKTESLYQTFFRAFFIHLFLLHSSTFQSSFSVHHHHPHPHHHPHHHYHHHDLLATLKIYLYKFNRIVGRGDPQEITRIIGEATSVVNLLVIKLWICQYTAWSIQTHFIKNAITFFFKCREASPTRDRSVERKFQFCFCSTRFH